MILHVIEIAALWLVGGFVFALILGAAIAHNQAKTDRYYGVHRAGRLGEPERPPVLTVGLYIERLHADARRWQRTEAEALMLLARLDELDDAVRALDARRLDKLTEHASRARGSFPVSLAREAAVMRDALPYNRRAEIAR